MAQVRNGDVKILMVSVERLKTSVFVTFYLSLVSRNWLSMKHTVSQNGTIFALTT